MFHNKINLDVNLTMHAEQYAQSYPKVSEELLDLTRSITKHCFVLESQKSKDLPELPSKVLVIEEAGDKVIGCSLVSVARYRRLQSTSLLTTSTGYRTAAFSAINSSSLLTQEEKVEAMAKVTELIVVDALLSGLDAVEAIKDGVTASLGKQVEAGQETAAEVKKEVDRVVADAKEQLEEAGSALKKGVDEALDSLASLFKPKNK